MDYIYILGVKVHKIKKEDVLEKIADWLTGDKFHYITTVNPEFVLEAQEDKEFKEILNNADLSIPDGIGTKFAAWVFGKNIYRTAGANLVKDILELSEQKSCSTYFFVWKDGLSDVEEIKGVIKVKAGDGQSRRLRIDGQAIERDGSDIDWEKFNNFKPDILLVGLGAPFQEKLIAKIKLAMNQLSDAHGKIPIAHPLEKRGIKVAIGVGGTFDFLTEKIKRAPKIMRILGLEWIWRLIQQPKKRRLKRIFNAVIVFPWCVVKWKICMSFQYRRSVTAVIINKENKILLCQRSDDFSHWQFTKGEVERDENKKDAVKREILEEVGLKNIKIIKKLDEKDVYTYNQPRHQGNLIKLKNGFKGQISDIFIVVFLGGEEIKIDNKEFSDYKWVSKVELLDSLHPLRKKVGQIVLKELGKMSKI